MPKQYKWITLMVVMVAVLAVLGLSNLDYFTSDEAEPADPTEEYFTATDQPYRAYEEARAEGRPIFLEFYADW